MHCRQRGRGGDAGRLATVSRYKYDIDISPRDGVEGLRRREFIIDGGEVAAVLRLLLHLRGVRCRVCLPWLRR